MACRWKCDGCYITSTNYESKEPSCNVCQYCQEQLQKEQDFKRKKDEIEKNLNEERLKVEARRKEKENAEQRSLEAQERLIKLKNDQQELERQNQEDEQKRAEMKIKRLFKAKRLAELSIPKYGLKQKNKYCIAMAGHACVGKSSLVNSIRGLLPQQPGAAEVGVWEVTQDIQEYAFNEPLSHISLYDCPGSGTSSHLSADYFVENPFCAFDLIILFLQDTFTVEEILFIREAVENGLDIICVKSQMDKIYENFVSEGRINKDLTLQKQAEEVKQIYKLRSRKILARDSQDLLFVPIFCVSSKAMYRMTKNQECDVKFDEKEFIEFITDRAARHIEV